VTSRLTPLPGKLIFQSAISECGHREVSDSTPKPSLGTLRTRGETRLEMSFVICEKHGARMTQENRQAGVQWLSASERHPPTPNDNSRQPLVRRLVTTTLRLRRRASRDVSLAHPYRALGMAVLRRRDCQVVRPNRRLAKVADGPCRYFDARLHFDTHLSGQAPRTDNPSIIETLEQSAV
jgi:hypothetical protein